MPAPLPPPVITQHSPAAAPLAPKAPNPYSGAQPQNSPATAAGVQAKAQQVAAEGEQAMPAQGAAPGTASAIQAAPAPGVQPATNPRGSSAPAQGVSLGTTPPPVQGPIPGTATERVSAQGLPTATISSLPAPGLPSATLDELLPGLEASPATPVEAAPTIDPAGVPKIARKIAYKLPQGVPGPGLIRRSPGSSVHLDRSSHSAQELKKSSRQKAGSGLIGAPTLGAVNSGMPAPESLLHMAGGINPQATAQGAMIPNAGAAAPAPQAPQLFAGASAPQMPAIPGAAGVQPQPFEVADSAGAAAGLPQDPAIPQPDQWAGPQDSGGLLAAGADPDVEPMSDMGFAKEVMANYHSLRSDKAATVSALASIPRPVGESQPVRTQRLSTTMFQQLPTKTAKLDLSEVGAAAGLGSMLAAPTFAVTEGLLGDANSRKDVLRNAGRGLYYGGIGGAGAFGGRELGRQLGKSIGGNRNWEAGGGLAGGVGGALLSLYLANIAGRNMHGMIAGFPPEEEKTAKIVDYFPGGGGKGLLGEMSDEIGDRAYGISRKVPANLVQTGLTSAGQPLRGKTATTARNGKAIDWDERYRKLLERRGELPPRSGEKAATSSVRSIPRPVEESQPGRGRHSHDTPIAAQSPCSVNAATGGSYLRSKQAATPEGLQLFNELSPLCRGFFKRAAELKLSPQQLDQVIDQVGERINPAVAEELRAGLAKAAGWADLLAKGVGSGSKLLGLGSRVARSVPRMLPKAVNLGDDALRAVPKATTAIPRSVATSVDDIVKQFPNVRDLSNAQVRNYALQRSAIGGGGSLPNVGAGLADTAPYMSHIGQAVKASPWKRLNSGVDRMFGYRHGFRNPLGGALTTGLMSSGLNFAAQMGGYDTGMNFGESFLAGAIPGAGLRSGLARSGMRALESAGGLRGLIGRGARFARQHGATYRGLRGSAPKFRPAALAQAGAAGIPFTMGLTDQVMGGQQQQLDDWGTELDNVTAQRSQENWLKAFTDPTTGEVTPEGLQQLQQMQNGQAPAPESGLMPLWAQVNPEKAKQMGYEAQPQGTASAAGGDPIGGWVDSLPGPIGDTVRAGEKAISSYLGRLGGQATEQVFKEKLGMGSEDVKKLLTQVQSVATKADGLLGGGAGFMQQANGFMDQIFNMFGLGQLAQSLGHPALKAGLLLSALAAVGGFATGHNGLGTMGALGTMAGVLPYLLQQGPGAPQQGQGSVQAPQVPSAADRAVAAPVQAPGRFAPEML